MTAAERYAALRSLYLHWFAQTGSDYHFAMADYCEQRIAEAVGG